ncbi:MAG: hypothetical protein OQK63_03315 [Ignavibacteriaceae bacterium]|nr:hypothetical protein [Ignavibacteriaceae bacterium]
MKTEKRIIKYLDNDLTSEERTAFERELKSSEELKREFEKYSIIKEKIKNQKNLRLNSDYLSSILPEFHNKVHSGKKETLRRGLSYAFGLILLFLIGISFQKIFFNNSDKERNDLEKFTQSLNDNQKLDLLESLNGSDDLYNIILGKEYVDLLENDLVVNEDVLKTYDIGYKDLIGNLSDNDVEKIYNELLNRNI